MTKEVLAIGKKDANTIRNIHHRLNVHLESESKWVIDLVEPLSRTTCPRTLILVSKAYFSKYVEE